MQAVLAEHEKVEEITLLLKKSEPMNIYLVCSSRVTASRRLGKRRKQEMREMTTRRLVLRRFLKGWRGLYDYLSDPEW